MYKELIDDIPGFSHPGHGTLIGWANQGNYIAFYYSTTMKFYDLPQVYPIPFAEHPWYDTANLNTVHIYKIMEGFL